MENKDKLKQFFELGYTLKIHEYTEHDPKNPEILIHSFSKVSRGMEYYTVWTTGTLTDIGSGGSYMPFDEIYKLIVDLLSKTDYDVNNVWMTINNDKQLINILENPVDNMVVEFAYTYMEKNPYTHTAFTSGLSNEDMNDKINADKAKFLREYKEKMELCKQVSEKHSPHMHKVMISLMDFYDKLDEETKIKVHQVFFDHSAVQEIVIVDCNNLNRNEFNTLARMFWDAFDLEKCLNKIKNIVSMA